MYYSMKKYLSLLFLFASLDNLGCSVGSVSTWSKICWNITFILSAWLAGREVSLNNLDFCHVLSACIIHKSIINSFHSDKCSLPTVNTAMTPLMHFQWCCCGLKVSATSAEDTVSIFPSLRSDSAASVFFLFIFLTPISHFSSSYFNSHRRGEATDFYVW